MRNRSHHDTDQCNTDDFDGDDSDGGMKNGRFLVGRDSVLLVDDVLGMCSQSGGDDYLSDCFATISA